MKTHLMHRPPSIECLQQRFVPLKRVPALLESVAAVRIVSTRMLDALHQVLESGHMSSERFSARENRQSLGLNSLNDTVCQHRIGQQPRKTVLYADPRGLL